MTLRKARLVGCSFAAVAAFLVYWFNVFYYPSHDINWLDKSEYTTALDTVARGYARSVGWSLHSVESVQCMATAFDDSTYVWASAALLPKRSPLMANRQTRHVWIFLAKKGHNKPWVRRELLLLANPAENALYSDSRFFGLDMIALRIKLLVDEQIRRVSEVLSG